MQQLLWCPRKHRRLARDLLAQCKGDEEQLRRRLLNFSLDILAGASVFQLRAVEPDDEEDLPTVEGVLDSALRPHGLALDEFFPGRPTTALVVATGQPVRIGDEDENEVVIAHTPTPAKVVSITARGAASSAVFSVSLKESRTRIGLRPHHCDLVFFVLRSEGGRVWAMTWRELLVVDEALDAGKKLTGFARGPGGSVRVSLPQKVTGLDFRFPRVAPWSGDT